MLNIYAVAAFLSIYYFSLPFYIWKHKKIIVIRIKRIPYFSKIIFVVVVAAAWGLSLIYCPTKSTTYSQIFNNLH